VICGKNPSILEKWWGARRGAGLNCLVVRFASSIAVMRPRIVTRRAASLSRGGIDIIGVFKGVILEVIKRPATMLPQAKRLIGLITAELFSLIGEKARKRGRPPATNSASRRL